MGVIGYILGLVFITSLSLVSFVFFILNTDPETLKSLEFIIFYLSFFLASAGIFTLVGVILRRINTAYRLSWKIIGPALRQAIIFSLVFTLLLIMASWQLVNCLISLLMLLAGVLFELLIYLINKRSHATGIRKN